MKLRSGLVVLSLVCTCGMAQAAVSTLAEDFDNITTLSADGWLFVNNSTPGGTTGWFQGNPGVFSAHSGAPNAYIAANFENAPLGGAISNWLITPEIAFSSTQNNPLQVALRAAGDGFLDSIEIYYSTSGASVGNTPTSTGDFTLIQRFDFDTDIGWMLVDLAIAPQAAAGRYAFRYVVDDTNVNGNYIGIDSVRIGFGIVPEPTSAALLMLGVAGLALTRRRGLAT